MQEHWTVCLNRPKSGRRLFVSFYSVSGLKTTKKKLTKGFLHPYRWIYYYVNSNYNNYSIRVNYTPCKCSTHSFWIVSLASGHGYWCTHCVWTSLLYITHTLPQPGVYNLVKKTVTVTPNLYQLHSRHPPVPYAAISAPAHHWVLGTPAIGGGFSGQSEDDAGCIGARAHIPGDNTATACRTRKVLSIIYRKCHLLFGHITNRKEVHSLIKKKK